MYCVLHGELECTIKIIKTGADTNVQDSSGKTAGDLSWLYPQILFELYCD